MCNITIKFCSKEETSFSKEAFELLDKNKSGFVIEEELKKWNALAKRDDSRLSKVMEGVNVSKSAHGITYSEFMSSTVERKNLVTD